MNTESGPEITESTEQCTGLTNECNAQRKVFDLADIVRDERQYLPYFPRKSKHITKIIMF